MITVDYTSAVNVAALNFVDIIFSLDSLMFGIFS